MNEEKTSIDKFQRTLQSYYFEDLIQNTLITKPSCDLGVTTIDLEHKNAINCNSGIMKDSDKKYWQTKEMKVVKKNINLANLSKKRNSSLIDTCNQIHEIFNNCCTILGPEFYETQIMKLKVDNESQPESKIELSNGKLRKRRSKDEIINSQIYKCNVPGCFKQYASKAALFVHIQRLHKPKSNFDQEINNELIQVLENHKEKLSNPNTKLRWGVDLNKVIKQRFSNFKKEGDSFVRADRSTYCDTFNNTTPKHTTNSNNNDEQNNFDTFTSNVEIFSNYIHSENFN